MRPVNLFEYESLARDRMDRAAWDYYRSGAEDEITLRENRAAFERIKLRPRMLMGVGTPDTSVEMLGSSLTMPILIAPAAYQKLAHPDGEAAMARGAGAAGTIMAVSTMATTSLEDVAQTARGPLWFQLYVYKDRDVTESLVHRAEQAGYQALMVTVDAPHLGRREADIRNGFGLPPHLSAANFTGRLSEKPATAPGASAIARYSAELIDHALTWESVEWLCSITKLPVIVKGILTAEDAHEAAKRSIAGVIVSNHGGRQLDGVLAAIEALPEVVKAVDGRCDVLVDGGIRRGTDVLKALALGARAVLIGRPALWALAVDGEAGVEQALTMLNEELKLAMALAGRKSLSDIDASLVLMR